MHLIVSVESDIFHAVPMQSSVAQGALSTNLFIQLNNYVSIKIQSVDSVHPLILFSIITSLLINIKQYLYYINIII